MPKPLVPRPPRKHVWDRRRPVDVPATPPPPPVEGPRVVEVRYRALESDGALWAFSAPVEDPVDDDLAQLAIAGLTALSVERVDEASFIVWYDGSVAPGDAWSNVEGAAGIVGTDDGLPIAAGSGAVTG